MKKQLTQISTARAIVILTIIVYIVWSIVEFFKSDGSMYVAKIMAGTAILLIILFHFIATSRNGIEGVMSLFKKAAERKGLDFKELINVENYLDDIEDTTLPDSDERFLVLSRMSKECSLVNLEHALYYGNNEGILSDRDNGALSDSPLLEYSYEPLKELSHWAGFDINYFGNLQRVAEYILDDFDKNSDKADVEIITNTVINFFKRHGISEVKMQQVVKSLIEWLKKDVLKASNEKINFIRLVEAMFLNRIGLSI